MYSADLIEAQRAFERSHAERGALRYLMDQDRKAEFEGFDKRDDVQKMIRGAIPILSQALTAWVEEASARKGRPSAALGPLKEIDADVVALAALSKCFSSIAKKLPIAATAVQIGRVLQVQIESKMIAETDPKAATKFLKMIEGGATERRALKRHDEILEALKAGLQWPQRVQYLVGGTVLNVVLESLEGVFERSVLKDERGAIPILQITEEATQALAGLSDAIAWTRPLLKPMLVPPRKWSRLDTGAYLELPISKLVPMVRTFGREHQKLLREAIKSGTMAPVMKALNGIQETRFAIDTRVLEIARWAKDEGLQPSESFPLTRTPELPKKLKKDEWDALPLETRIAKSRERTTKRNILLAAGVNTSVFNTDLKEAEGLSKTVDAFFLPHSMDTRGRVYAVPHFNPQRSDHVKALFRFADPQPMGVHGGFWLSVHLANCGDFKVPSGQKASKSTFPERTQWVRDNEEMILACAHDPKENYALWGAADSPFCFLQACFEYAEYAASGFSPEFPGTIAIALDGSCSGLQHYSAMNRSAEEGYHVNLLPRDTVGDIYQVVCDTAAPGLEARALAGDVACTLILTPKPGASEFGRGTLKTNTMTYFYGSGKFGMRDQHMINLMRPLGDKVALGALVEHPYNILVEREDKETGENRLVWDNGFTVATTLANAAYNAIVTVAPQADKAANWFQGVAALLAHESLPVIWTTPMGLPVVQRYSEYTSKVVNMWLYDRNVSVPDATSTDKVEGEKVLTRITSLLREAPTKRIDKKKARSAIAPNVVHSLDAAHLQRVVTMGLDAGIVHFLLIHDSFATHAGRTEEFFRIIREAFVEQYETYCPFEALETYARSVLSEEGLEKLGKLDKPVRGTLDLRSVLEAQYAFA